MGRASGVTLYGHTWLDAVVRIHVLMVRSACFNIRGPGYTNPVRECGGD